MEDDIEFVKPKEIHKRRSSFFQRRLSSVSCDSPTRATLLVNQSNLDSSQEDKITEYINKLKKEKEDWKDLDYQKTALEAELSEKCPPALLSENFLTANDKKFLADRPNYLAIARLVDNVTDGVMIKQRRINNTMDMINSLIDHCEQITNEQAENVIDYFMDEYDEFGPAPGS